MNEVLFSGPGKLCGASQTVIHDMVHIIGSGVALANIIDETFDLS